MIYKAMLFVSVLVAILTMMGSTTPGILIHWMTCSRKPFANQKQRLSSWN